MGVESDSVLCDASSLISITDSCLLPLLEAMSKKMGGGFLISPTVKFESIDNPKRFKSHALAAIRMERALREGVFRVAELSSLSEGTDELLQIVNSIFYVGRKPLRLVHRGEAELLVLARGLGVQNILMDERTTRMLVEDPLGLKSHMEKEFRRPLGLNERNLERFEQSVRGFSIFRSSELLVVAYERGLLKPFGESEKEALRAGLYALKFSGCAISFAEIDEYFKMED